MPWGYLIQGSPVPGLKESEYQRYMKRCWLCLRNDMVDLEDQLGLCDGCVIALRDPGYLTPVQPSERVQLEHRELD